jgi:hypothetical protein
MTRQSGKIKYSSWNFIQDIIGFIFNYFFSFPDPGQDHIAKTYDNHIQPDEPQKINPNFTVHVHTPTPVKILDRYKPLVLPPTLHDFPTN